MRKILRDAINKGKVSGVVEAVTLTYSLGAIEPLLVPHPTLDNVLVIRNTLITQSAFELEVLNAFNQWVFLFNDMYSSYITLQFAKIEEGADLHVQFKSGMVSTVDQTTNNIDLNLGLNWATYLHPKGVLLLNHLVYNIGLCLRLPETFKPSPMNHKFLGIYYPSVLNVTVGEGGEIIDSALISYKAIRRSILDRYGSAKNNTPLIYGCTNPTALTYNPVATVDNGSCIFDTPDLVRNSISANVRYALRTSVNEHYLASASSVLPVNTDNFTVANTIPATAGGANTLNVSFADGSNILTSLVITDKGPSSAGDTTGMIRYYVVANNKDIAIFNHHGQQLSNNSIIRTTSEVESTVDMDIFLANFNISYYKGRVDEIHVISWVSKDGSLNVVTLDDREQQLSGDSVVPFCDSDTLDYGNVVKFDNYPIQQQLLHVNSNQPIQVNESGQIASEEGYSDTSMGLMLIPGNTTVYNTNYNWSNTSAFNSAVFAGNEDIATNVNLKSFILPTVTGRVHVSLDVYANTVRVQGDDGTLGELIPMTWLGDSAASLLYSNTGQGIDEGTNFRNTNYDVTSLNSLSTLNALLYRPFSLGFSFSGSSIKDISSNTYVLGNYNGRFSGSVTADTSLWASLPVSIGNKLFNNTFFGNTNLGFLSTNFSGDLGFDVYGSFPGEKTNYLPNLNHVGDFHLAIAVKHGFILTKINNTNYSLVSPATEAGLEVHVSGGNPTIAGFNDGWTPICMQFSPDDNFLYTIIRNPEDHTEKKIAIYNIYPGSTTSGCVLPFGDTSISTTCKVIDNEFDGDLMKITLQDDGAIYIWSDSSQYHKISDPDLLLSVDNFHDIPTVYTVAGSFDYLASNSYLSQALSRIEGWNFGDLEENSGTDIRLQYAETFNSSLPGVAMGAGMTPILDSEYNSKIVGPGYTYDVTTGTAVDNTLSSDYIVSSATQTADTEDSHTILSIHATASTINILGSDGEVIHTFSNNISTNPVAVDSKNSVFILPIEGNGLYLCGYVSGVGVECGTSGQYSYRVIKATADGEGYAYEISATEGSIGTSCTEGTVGMLRGAEISKIGVESYIFYQTGLAYNSTVGEGPNIILYKTKINNSINIDLKNTPNIVRELDYNPTVGTFADSYLGEYQGYNIKNAVITVSKNLQYIAIAVSGYESNTDVGLCSIHVYALDRADDSSLGAVVGEKILITSEDYLIGRDFSTHIDQAIRSMEFSPASTRLYVLIGLVGSAETTSSMDADYSTSFGKYHRVMRLLVDAPNNVFSFNGALSEGSQTVEPSGARNLSLFTYADGVSHQGNQVYKDNSAIMGLHLLSDGEIAVLNTHNSVIDGNLIKHNGGFILNPDFDTSNLVPNARVLLDESEGRLGLGGNKGSGGDNNVLFVGDPTPDEHGYPTSYYGCTDSTAVNYDAGASLSDDSCIYFDDYDPSSGGITEGCPTGTPSNITFGLYEFIRHLPSVAEDLEDLATIEGCETDNSVVGAVLGVINAENISLAISGSFYSLYCGCQATYYITATHAYSYNESGNHSPWATGICSGSVSKTYVYIPIVTYTGAYGYYNVMGNNTYTNLNLDETIFPYQLDQSYPGDREEVESFYTVNNIADSYSHPEFGFIGDNPDNFMPAEDFDPDYCIVCNQQSTPMYSQLSNVYAVDIEPFMPWRTPISDSYGNGSIVADAVLSYCGEYGCIDSTACNYSPTATVDNGSCIYAPIVSNPNGVDVSLLCECSNSGTLQNSPQYYQDGGANAYCGDCSTPEEIELNPPHCDCSGYPDLISPGTPTQEGYWGDCNEDLQPTATNVQLGCIYDDSLSGVLVEPSSGFTAPDCDCDGNAGLSTAKCDCEGVITNSLVYCDCNTQVTMFYLNTEGGEFADCSVEPVPLCQYSESAAIQHSEMGAMSEGEWLNTYTHAIYTEADITDNYVTTVNPALNPDYCSVCGGDAVLLDSGWIQFTHTSGIRYKCSCSTDAVLHETIPTSGSYSSQCCDGYVTGTCVVGCIPMNPDETLMSPNGCDSCQGLSETGGVYTQDGIYPISTDECGNCTEGGVTEYNAAGCCNNQVLDCYGECVESNPVENDECGVCGGDTSTCTGCTDSAANNFSDTATIEDGSCTYDVIEVLTSLYDQINSVVLDTTGTEAPTLESTYVLGSAEENLTLIAANPDFFMSYSSVLGEDVSIDQKYYTRVCQPISEAASILYIENPGSNAEIAYPENGEESGTIVQHGSNAEIFPPDNTISTYTAWYFFRLVEGLALTSYDPTVIFADYLDKINVIKDANGLVYWPEFGFNNMGDLQTGINTDISPVTDYAEGSTLTVDAEHIYLLKPRINPDTNHPYEFSLDFSSFIFIPEEPVLGCTDSTADNYNASATENDGSCVYPCVDTDGDGTCDEYETYGCTNPNATNYDQYATEEDNSCLYLVEGCTDATANNYNPAATVNNGSCTYELVGEGLTLTMVGANFDATKLKWVLYDTNNTVLKANLGNYPSSFANGTPYVENLENHIGNAACMYFIPIGFKYEDAWQNVRLVISRNSTVYQVLDFGSEAYLKLDGRGTFAIKLDNGDCTLGCGNTTPTQLSTDYCIASVKKDVKEFTDISFTVETASSTDNLIIEVYNIDLGSTLMLLDGEFEASTEYVNTFSIDTKTRVGIRVNNPFNVTLKYSMVSEFGEIIIKKTIN